MIFKKFFILLSVLFFAALISCEKPKAKKLKIGFSQLITGDNWRKTMYDEMLREASFHQNIELVLADSKGSLALQNQQVHNFIESGFDLIIVCPVDVDSIFPALQEARNKKIPIISIDRKIKEGFCDAFVGTENYLVGKTAGNYASNRLNGRGNVLEIGQDPKSSPSIDRHKGFVDEIVKYPGINNLGTFWLPTNHKSYLKEIFEKENPDLVFTHNDRFALEVHETLKELQLTNKIKVVGVDGLMGQNEGLDLVKAGKIDATILYPTGGQESIKVAIKILQGENFIRENNLFSTVVNSENVSTVIAQFTKIKEQQEEIDKQLIQIASINNTYISQRNRLYFISSLLIIITGLGSLLYYLLREKQLSNKKLEEQNIAISNQKNEIEKVSELAKKAIEDKMRFYSYVSHEFKTPLSLILTPVEDLLTKEKIDTKEVVITLNLIKKNGNRLLRLVNQLLEMRQLDSGKMGLSLQKIDLVSFLKEIVSDFEVKARIQSIDLRLFTARTELFVDLDIEKFDKIIFNLLSNAFKYTPSNGFIFIELVQNKDRIIIKIKDSGKGMSELESQNAFELFYRGNKNISLGSGLGLALTKEYILLHNGTITLDSKVGEGTLFTIDLPLINSTELDLTNEINTSRMDDINLLESDCFSTNQNSNQNLLKDDCIVLIEDNQDLNIFLTDKLLPNYQVISCVDAESGWEEILENIPDIVISDVMLPGMDGFALIQKIKNDFRTSHIPVILLTAKSNIESEIEGTELGADAYISKPFNQQLLEGRIKTILQNRTKSSQVYFNQKLNKQPFLKGEKKFLIEFEKLIEENMKNGSLSVEKLSKELGMSRVQLFRKISALTEKNVVDYISDFRLNKAFLLLRETDNNISEIAYELGFSSPSYFTTFFRQKTNVTPSQWRESLGNI